LSQNKNITNLCTTVQKSQILYFPFRLVSSYILDFCVGTDAMAVIFLVISRSWK